VPRDVRATLGDRRRAGLLDVDHRRHVGARDRVVIGVADRRVLVVLARDRHHVGVALATIEHQVARRVVVEPERGSRGQRDRAAVGRFGRRQQVAQLVVAQRRDRHRVGRHAVVGDHEVPRDVRATLGDRRRAGLLDVDHRRRHAKVIGIIGIRDVDHHALQIHRLVGDGRGVRVLIFLPLRLVVGQLITGAASDRGDSDAGARCSAVQVEIRIGKHDVRRLIDADVRDHELEVWVGTIVKSWAGSRVGLDPSLARTHIRSSRHEDVLLDVQSPFRRQRRLHIGRLDVAVVGQVGVVGDRRDVRRVL